MGPSYKVLIFEFLGKPVNDKTGYGYKQKFLKLREIGIAGGTEVPKRKSNEDALSKL